jgi:membrane fusion protein, multidrug efflux system
MAQPATEEKPVQPQQQSQSQAPPPEPVTPAKPPATPAQRVRRVVIGLIILAILVIGGLLLWAHLSSYESTDDAQIDGHINATSARVAGTVKQVNVQENQNVEAGKVLVQIDPRDYQVAVDQAKADLADAVANAASAQTDIPVTTATTTGNVINARAGTLDAEQGVLVAERGVNAARARVGAAQARVNEAQANYDKAAKDLARLKMLVAKDEISQQQYDASVAAAEAAKATRDSMLATLNEAQQNVRVSESQVGQSQARVTQAQAQVQTALTGPRQVAGIRAKYDAALAQVQLRQAAVAQAELNLSYTTIRSPVNGVIGKKSVEIGQNVTVGQELMAVVPLDDIWITANFKETQLKKIRLNQKVNIHVDAFDRDYKGYVESLSPASGARFSLLPPENATGNYVKVVQRLPVRIRFEQGENGDHRLRPGMSVTPKVFLQ